MSFFQNKHHLPVIVGVILILIVVFFTMTVHDLEHDMRMHAHHHDSYNLEHIDQDQLKQRLEKLELLIVNEPQEIKWKTERAHIQLTLNPNEAVKEFRKLHLERPNDLYLLLHLSQSLIKANDINLAFQYAQKLYALDRSSESLELMAQIYYRKKQYQKAMDYAEKCQKIDPKNSNIQKIIEYCKMSIPPN